ncbi:MAG: hypothetical protein HY015_05315 [Bacteroidetes bacterium]|nr:hypothetical protein [Bacteroidota bacterium]MBI3482380.1 hypothetical protein [Bacteroidota bacterium]
MKAKIVLNLGSTSNAQVLVDAAHYTTNMTGNALFAAADIVAQVTATVTATTNLRAAMNAPISDAKTDNISAARETLDRNLTILAAKVEAVANSPTLVDSQRVGIVHSAGMEVKNQAIPKKRVFTVTNGIVEGSVHLTAEGGANAHEWQYTSDVVNFTARVAALTTTTSSTDINGLKSGSKYAFFHKPILSGMSSDWEGPLYVTVI